MRPTREELMRALAVFDGWLKEEAILAERNVATSFKAGHTSLDQVAEQVGVATGLSGAAALLSARIERMTE